MANLAVGLIFAIVALGAVVQGRPGYDNSRFQAWQGKLLGFCYTFVYIITVKILACTFMPKMEAVTSNR